MEVHSYNVVKFKRFTGKYPSYWYLIKIGRKL